MDKENLEKVINKIERLNAKTDSKVFEWELCSVEQEGYQLKVPESGYSLVLYDGFDENWEAIIFHLGKKSEEEYLGFDNRLFMLAHKSLDKFNDFLEDHTV